MEKKGLSGKIKWISLAVILIGLIAIGACWLPFPWYVYKNLPIVYYQSENGSESEYGVMEVRGWMLCYLFKPDTFRGTIETFMSDATYSHGEYKAKVKVTFDRPQNPDVKLKGNYRYFYADTAECEGDESTFSAYWLNADYRPVIEGHFKNVILQKTHREGSNVLRDRYCIGAAKTIRTAQSILEEFLKKNTAYPEAKY